jgi:hypothetical protein
MTKEYLQKLDDYLIGDLDNMIEKADEVEKNAKDDQIINQLSVPITMSIFSALDVVGFLLRNTEHTKCEKNIVSYKKNISYSLLKWDSFGLSKLGFSYSDLMLIIDSDNFEKKFISTNLFHFLNNFRNGMAHSFFHKNFYINNQKKYEGNDLFFCSGENLYFNVRAFYKSFKCFYSDLKKYLDNKENTPLIDKNLQCLINYNTKDEIDFKHKLKTNYCDIENIHDGISGTSGTSGLSGTSGPSVFNTESYNRS